MAILHPARRRRRGVSQSQRRSGDPSDLPSGREAHRGPHLHRLPGLLHADHPDPSLHALAPGLTARSALEKFAAVQMIDVHPPTTDGREILLTRYTHPEPELQLLIDQLKLKLPPQPPPRITAADLNQPAAVVKTF